MLEKYLKDLDEWYTSAVGQEILSIENQVVNQSIQNILGNYLLQSYGLCMMNESNNSPIVNKLTFSHCKNFKLDKPNVIGSYLALPFLTNSINLFLLSHILEFHDSPETVLAECCRVLKPEGQIVILGFNPWSVWYMFRFFLKNKNKVPWNSQFISANKIRMWLKKLDYQIIKTQHFFYRLPVNNKELLKKSSFMDYFNKFSWLGGGAVYMIVAQKRVIPLKTIRAKWKSRRVIVGKGLIEPTARGSHGFEKIS